MVISSTPVSRWFLARGKFPDLALQVGEDAVAAFLAQRVQAFGEKGLIIHLGSSLGDVPPRGSGGLYDIFIMRRNA